MVYLLQCKKLFQILENMAFSHYLTVHKRNHFAKIESIFCNKRRRFIITGNQTGGGDRKWVIISSTNPVHAAQLCSCPRTKAMKQFRCCSVLGSRDFKYKILSTAGNWKTNDLWTAKITFRLLCAANSQSSKVNGRLMASGTCTSPACL